MIDERYATYLPAPVATPSLLAVSLLAQASDLRRGLAQLAREAATDEERVGLEQACKAVDYVLVKLGGKR